MPEGRLAGLREVELLFGSKRYCMGCVGKMLKVLKGRWTRSERVLLGLGVMRVERLPRMVVDANVKLVREEDGAGEEKRREVPYRVSGGSLSFEVGEVLDTESAGVYKHWAWLDGVIVPEGMRLLAEFAVIGKVDMRCQQLYRGAEVGCGRACFAPNFWVSSILPQENCSG